jgi:putative sterol carrier protein
LPAALDGDALPSAGAIRLAIKAFFCPERAQGINRTYELHLGHEVLQAHVEDGTLHIQQGGSRPADAVFHTDMRSFLGLFTGQLQPADAIAAGLIRIEGDPQALSQFLGTCRPPGPPR